LHWFDCSWNQSAPRETDERVARKDGMILVCGGLADPVTELVCARLEDCAYPYRLLDLGRYPAAFKVNYRWQFGRPIGYIASTEWHIELEELSGVFVRYPGLEGRIAPANLAPECAPAVFGECDMGLAAMLESLSCPVVNRLAGSISNYSKPYQQIHIQRCGLRTPPTLVTNDPGSALKFYHQCGGQVIFKSISSVRSIVRRMTAAHLERLAFLHDAPAQFQAFIPGEDIRVHTIGNRWFATRIVTNAVDYRYAQQEGLTVQMEPTTLPAEVVDACLRLANHFELLLTGIDLKQTREGEYYCFEVNPAPAFLVYEQGSGQEISRSLAEILHRTSR
jgi:hypothetical protein